MRATLKLILLATLISVPAQASYFEFCRLEGTVEAPPRAECDVVRFSMKVVSAKPATCGKGVSYNPEVCQTYLGKSLEVTLPKAALASLAATSNVAIIQRVWDEEYGPDKGTRVAYQLPDGCK